MAVTFVDALGAVLIARTPALLDKVINELLSILVTTFEQAHRQINWAKGKTEALLKHRGKYAVAARERRRQHGGSHGVAVPNFDRIIHVVDAYCHLGTYVSLDRFYFANVTHCVKSAMGAYAPFSHRILAV